MSEKRAFTVELDVELADSFTDFVDNRGLKKTRAIAGAVRAFMALPSELQTQLIANNACDVYTMLVRGLVESEIQKHLDDLGPAKEKFLALLKQAKATKPRKKQAL